MAFLAQGQSQEGEFIYDQLYSTTLENIGGEETTMRVSVYLPSGYDMSNDKYPVIY